MASRADAGASPAKLRAVGASTTPTSAGSAAAADGSQTGHSRAVGAISWPHSGQIQWNMSLIYTDVAAKPFRDLPYAGKPRNPMH